MRALYNTDELNQYSKITVLENGSIDLLIEFNEDVALLFNINKDTLYERLIEPFVRNHRLNADKKLAEPLKFVVECKLNFDTSVNKILSVSCSESIVKYAFLNGEANVSGRINFNVELLDNKGVASRTEHSADFATKINMKGITPDKDVKVVCTILDTDVLSIKANVVNVACLAELSLFNTNTENINYRIRMVSEYSIGMGNIWDGVHYLECGQDLEAAILVVDVIAAKSIKATAVECRELYCDRISDTDITVTEKAGINSMYCPHNEIKIKLLRMPCGNWKRDK